MVPMRGCSVGSTTSTRLVPIASGFPGQSAADATAGTPTDNDRAQSRARTRISKRSFRTEPSIEPEGRSANSSSVSDKNLLTAWILSDSYLSPGSCREFCQFVHRRPPQEGIILRCWNNMHDLVATSLQRAEEGRDHGGGLRLGVVEEDDAAVGGLEPRERERQLLRRAHPVPVARPEIGAEYHEAARLHALEQRRRGRKSGKAEERRARLCADVAVDRALDGGDTAVDLGIGGGETHAAEQRMREAVVRDGVSLGEFALRQRGRGGGIAAEQEERRVHAFVLERVEHLCGGARPRSVVEREYHLLRRERQRRGKLLAADARRRGRAHREHALGAERIGIARTGLGRHDPGECNARQCKENARQGKEEAKHGQDHFDRLWDVTRAGRSAIVTRVPPYGPANSSGFPVISGRKSSEKAVFPGSRRLSRPASLTGLLTF